MKKITSLLLMIVFTLSLAMPIFAAENTNPVITVQSVSGSPSSMVDVDVTIKNNPGILGATLSFTYDNGLTLTGATSGDAFSALTMTKPGKFTSPCNFTWDAQEISTDDIKDGTVLTLQFTINDNAENGTEYNITASYESGDIVGTDLNPIDVEIENGTVTAIDYMPGDLNSDKKVNPTDIILLRRFIAGGYEQSINEAAADVNNDGKKNPTDVILIRRYIAGGYGVDLMPSKPSDKCEHNMEANEYRAPSCEDDGNIAFWHCTACDKYYSDELGMLEISINDITIPATGHNIVIDNAVKPTYESTGLTEGKHCSVCNTVIVAQQEIPKLEKDQYSITYYVDSNDNYLKSLNITNPNPSVYSKQDGLVLQDLMVDGYNFVGWYTAQTGGERVSEITAGTIGNRTLYAHWEKVEYTINFASDMVPINDIHYKVGEEKSLPKPTLDKYTFVGWSDKDGKIWNSIPAGTTGNITLYANWSSNRNKAEVVKTLEEPLIFEDTNKGLMLFTYEIGQIKNVPLFETLKLQCANGLITTVSKTDTEQIGEDSAKTIAQTISNATTNSSSWTLSSDWNKSTEVSQSYLDQTGQTREEAETIAKSSSNTYNLSKSSGGSNSNTHVDSNSYKLSGNNSHSNSSSVEAGQNAELSVDTKVSAGVSGSIGGVVDATAGIEVGIGASQGAHITTTNAGTNGWSNSEEENSASSNTSISSKTWNTSSGYSNSKTTSSSKTIANIVSKVISEQYGYGESYSEGGSNSQSQALASSNSKSDEYSSTLTYHTSKIKSTTTTFESTGNTMGNYRMVMAGTVHVFATVGYDVATQSYFVYTYNVLDDKTEEYLDYSFDGTFNDYETSIVPFEIPYFVNEYVNNKIAKTDGLMFDPETGIIVDYAPTGDKPDNIVVIPSYIAVNNNDGTFTSVKVTGIASGLFKNNKDIVAVQLGNFIDKIPDSTFEGCSSLKYVLSSGVTKIGNNAFAGCTSLNSFTVPKDITEFGENAFEGAPEIKAAASSADIAQAVASSGANKITLDISAIPDTESANMDFNIGNITSFELQGKDKEYRGLSLKSDAETTVINGVTFTENTKTPMELSSENVTLDRVAADCSGYALVLKANETNLLLNRSINLMSTSENAVISKSVNLSNLSSSIVGKLNITGNMLVCGEVSGDRYITFNNGEIKYITDEEYENYLTSHKIIFDANGGTVSVSDKMASLNMAIGELPTPSRDYYTFDGWYTKANGGEKVTENTIMTSLTDMTLYAHWTLNNCTVIYNANGGEGGYSEEIHKNSKLTEPSNVLKIGYNLEGWYKDSKLTHKWDFDNDTITDNITLYAKWQACTYVLSFDSNGGSKVSDKTVSYDNVYGSMPSTSRTGYTFDGWYTETNGGEKITDSSIVSITSDCILYAHWNRIYVYIPNQFVGGHVDTLKSWLSSNGLQANAWGEYDYNTSYGTVLRHDHAGNNVEYGTTINIAYSLGVKPFEEGDWVYYNGGGHYSGTNGGSGPYYSGAGTWQIAYIRPGNPYPYCLHDGTGKFLGWTTEDCLTQQSNS